MEAQEFYFGGLADRIEKVSRHFDLDSAGQKTKFDDFIKQGAIAKTMESDNLYWFEGLHDPDQTNFITNTKYLNEIRDVDNWESVSAGDYPDDYEEKFDYLAERVR
jgi:hypothetical protein